MLRGQHRYRHHPMAYDSNNMFARILRGEAPCHRIYEDAATLAFLDVMPQADGHSLVLPKAAVENLFELDDDAAAAVMRTGRRVALALREVYRPDGLTVMQFNGAEAGQTVFHFHLHLVPRFAGQPLRSHGRGMADGQLLAGQAARLRAVLGTV
jgi:histidine triad (HIT) family protein